MAPALQPLRNSAQSRPLPSAPHPILPPGASFLSQISLTADAPECIGRFLLRAEQQVRHLGITLEFSTLDELRLCNQQNRATWRPLVPVLDPSTNRIARDSAFCILGRDATGKIVATQAARLLDLVGTNLRAEAESLRLFYGDTPPDDLSVHLSAPSAPSISGSVVYSGGVWYHPRFRGQGLSKLLPRMSRALAIGSWKSDFVVSFVEEPLLKKDMAARYGYPRFERHFMLTDDRVGDVLFEGGLIWISRKETTDDLQSWLTGAAPEIDIIPHVRRA